MQITFDPLNETEAAFVRDMLGNATQTLTVGGVSAELTVQQMADLLRAGIQVAEEAASGEEPAALRAEVAATIAQADQPDTGADAPSGTPLPPDAPLPAAADLFGTAPAAPPAGEASAPIVPPAAAPSASVLPVIPAGDVDKHGLPWDDRIHSGTRVKNADGSWRQRRGVDAELVKTVENELRALMALPTRPGITLGSAGPLEQPSIVGTAMAPGVISDLVVKPGTATLATEPASNSPVAPSAAAMASPVNTVPTPPAPPVTAPAVSVPPTDAGNVPPPPVPAPPTSAPATAPIPSPPVPPAPIAAEPAAPLTFATMLRKVTDALAQNKIKETDVHAALEQIGLLPTQIGLLSARADLLPAFDMHIAAAIGASHA